MSNKKRSIIIAGIIILGAFASLRTFQNETQAQEPLVVPDTASVDTESNQKGREILALLAELKSVRLDESIFSDPIFQSLQDTSVELNQEPKGRPNPFAPLGKDVVLSEDFSGFATSSPRDIPFNTEVATSSKTKKTSSPFSKSGAPIVIPVGGQ